MTSLFMVSPSKAFFMTVTQTAATTQMRHSEAMIL